MIDTNTDFDLASAAVTKSFARALANGNKHLFATDATDLFDVYLKNFSNPEERQHHNCNACASFLRRFGGLVYFDPSGQLRPAMFDAEFIREVPGDMGRALSAMKACVGKARVTSQFFHADAVWGTPESNGWTHFAVTPAREMVFRPTPMHRTAGQARAASAQAHASVMLCLRDFNVDVLAAAITLLQSGTLARADQYLPAVLALFEVTESRVNAWQALAKLPALGNLRGSSAGLLLRALADGDSPDVAARKYKDAVDPLKYMVAQTAPGAGNIQQAEKLFAELGLEPALQRRYAAFDEVADKASWMPRPLKRASAQAKGVFDALKPAAAAVSTTGAKGSTMTWDRLRGTLKNVASIQLHVPASLSTTFGAVTTATDPAAPPLFAWDNPDARNPFSWYRWSGASGLQFSLKDEWVDVLAVLPLPATWGGGFANYDGAILVLDGARDTQADKASLGLFAEAMRKELFPVRSTITAFSQRGVIQDTHLGYQLAAGLVLRPDRAIGVTLRLTNDFGGTTDHVVDRWI